jgi:hypothetical protein
VRPHTGTFAASLGFGFVTISAAGCGGNAEEDKVEDAAKPRLDVVHRRTRGAGLAGGYLGDRHFAQL